MLFDYQKEVLWSQVERLTNALLIHGSVCSLAVLILLSCLSALPYGGRAEESAKGRTARGEGEMRRSDAPAHSTFAHKPPLQIYVGEPKASPVHGPLPLPLLTALQKRNRAPRRKQDASSARRRGKSKNKGPVVGKVAAQGKWFAPAGAPVEVREDVLWLARCIYAETNRPFEQELVAWVVRNRRDTRFAGWDTYKKVVLAPLQFSPFNHNSPRNKYFRWLPVDAAPPGWKEALLIAVYVDKAPAQERPFSAETRHFYSPVSMPGGYAPHWARGESPVAVDRNRQPSPRRFRFFENLNESG